MKVTLNNKHIVALLFACGTLFLTTGIVTAVQQNQAETTQQTHLETRPEQQPDIPEPCIQTAQAWLRLLDTLKYDESYRQLADAAKTHIPSLKWTRRLQWLRTHFGETIERTLITDRNIQKKYSIPDHDLAPTMIQGNKIKLYFETTLTGSAPVLETVFMQQQSDGTWKVYSYDAQPLSTDPNTITSPSRQTDQPPAPIGKGAEEPSVKTAMAWLELLDGGKYEEFYTIWKNSYVKQENIVPYFPAEKEFIRIMATCRGAAGPIISRQWKDTSPAHFHVENAAQELLPTQKEQEFDFISIRFTTSCIVDKSTAERIERVTMYRSKPNGQNTNPGPWKFYGYDIKHVL